MGGNKNPLSKNAFIFLKIHLTLSLPRSSYDDFEFLVFSSNFFPTRLQNYFTKNRFVTLFLIRFS